MNLYLECLPGTFIIPTGFYLVTICQWLQPMRRKPVWERKIAELLIGVFLMLLVPGMAHDPSTAYELLDEPRAFPGIDIVQVNDTAFMVLGLAQPSVAGGFLNLIGDLPGVRREQVNDTTYLFVLQPAGNLSAACGSLTADKCGVNFGLCSGNCPAGTSCSNCVAQTNKAYSSFF